MTRKDEEYVLNIFEGTELYAVGFGATNEPVKSKRRRRADACEEFKNMVCKVVGCKEEDVRVNEWSSKLYVFRVAVGTDWFFSISYELFGNTAPDAIEQEIRKHIENDPPVIKGIPSYCFLDQAFDCNDNMPELEARVHVLYLEPAYCQAASLAWNEKKNVFEASINNNYAYFALRDILHPNTCARDIKYFREWVSMTLDKERRLPPFITGSIEEEEEFI